MSKHSVSGPGFNYNGLGQADKKRSTYGLGRAGKYRPVQTSDVYVHYGLCCDSDHLCNTNLESLASPEYFMSVKVTCS